MSIFNIFSEEIRFFSGCHLYLELCHNNSPYTVHMLCRGRAKAMVNLYIGTDSIQYSL